MFISFFCIIYVRMQKKKGDKILKFIITLFTCTLAFTWFSFPFSIRIKLAGFSALTSDLWPCTLHLKTKNSVSTWIFYKHLKPIRPLSLNCSTHCRGIESQLHVLIVRIVESVGTLYGNSYKRESSAHWVSFPGTIYSELTPACRLLCCHLLHITPIICLDC